MAGLLWRHSVSKDLGMSVLRGGDGTAALQPCPYLMIGEHAERNWVTTLGVVGSLTDTHQQPSPEKKICHHICFSINPIHPHLAWYLHPSVTPVSLHG